MTGTEQFLALLMGGQMEKSPMQSPSTPRLQIACLGPQVTHRYHLPIRDAILRALSAELTNLMCAKDTQKLFLVKRHPGL